MIKTEDGGFAVAGTVTDCPEGLDPVTGKEHMFVVLVDADGNVISRQHYNGGADGSCGFAVTQAPDGSIIVAGNSEGENGNPHEENFLFIKTNSGCAFAGGDVPPNNGNDYVLTIDETWENDRFVNANVVVPAGRKLTIKGASASNRINIRFADSKETFGFSSRSAMGIRVQPGGQLSIQNAILSGADCNGSQRMWDGIVVSGNPNLTQTTANQGFMTATFADIVNARWGVTAANVWASSSQITTTYAGTGSQGVTQTSTLHHDASGGGRVLCFQTKFINNQRSAIFARYRHNWNNSRFLFTQFISDGAVVDQNDLRQPIANNFNYNEPRGTWAHVSIWSTRVQFSFGCTFSGSQSIIPDYRPFGIEGDDPKVVISGGSMTDVKIGIEARSPLGSMLGSVNASGVGFQNAVQGINLRNTVGDIISGCDFSGIPEHKTLGGLEPFGVFADKVRGILVQNNDFIGVNREKAYGLTINNTLNQGAIVKENRFFTTRTGNQFEGINSALFATCNDYTDMGNEAWSVLLDGGGNLPPQGDDDLLGSQADNEFFDPCTGQENHINSEFEFTYNEKTGNPHPAMAACVSPIVNLNTISSGTGLDCATLEPPCPNPPCDKYGEYQQSEGTIRDRNIALRGLIHTGFDGDGNDLPARYDEALAVLTLRNQPEDKIIKIGTLASMGEYQLAQAELAQLPSDNTENAAYKSFMQTLLADGNGDVSNLSEAKYQALLQHLDDDGTSAQAMAQTVRYMREGIYTPFTPIQNTGAGNRFLQSGGDLKPKMKGAGLVSPNPFTNGVAFDLTKKKVDVEYSLQISDRLGRIVWTSVAFGGNIVRWDAGSVSNGQYFFTIHSSDERPLTGKLVKISE